jgi:serine/threonine-protein kinase
VKPANVLLTSFRGQTDHVYLTDFGLTKRTSSITGGLTATGHFLGTIDYVAPEQIAGKPVDARADVYALGCMLYESLTGRVPFSRDDDAAILWAHLVETPPPVTALRGEVAPAVDAVVGRAMAKVPEERYNSCHELITELEEALQVAAPVRESRALVRVDSSPGLEAADPEHEQQTRPPIQHPSIPPGSVLTAGPTSHRRAPRSRRAARFVSASGRESNRRPGRVAVLVSVLVAVAALVAGLVYWWPFSATRDTSAARQTSAARHSASPSVLNRSSGATIKTTIPVGRAPQDVVVAPHSAPYAYVTNSGGPTISVINTRTQQQESRIRIIGAWNQKHQRRAVWRPQYVAFSPDGSHAYVSLLSFNKMRGAVAVINTAHPNKNEVVRDIIPLDHGPNSSMMNPSMMNSSMMKDWVPALSVNPSNTNLLYVPDFGHSRIDIVNLSMHRVTNHVSVDPMPHGIVFSQRYHRAYITNHYANEVSVLNTRTNKVIRTIRVFSPGKNPHSLAISRDKKSVYVTDIGSGDVSVISADKVVKTIPVGSSPRAIAFSPDGSQAYVVNYDSNNVSVINTQSRKTFYPIKVGTKPTSVSFDNSGHAYVTNFGDDTVTVISTNLATGPPK